MSKKPLCVAFLWHMHQPDYRNTQTRDMFLPWVRFHAVKDYYDMGALIERARNIHLTINVVPSLMEQLAAYGDGTAHESYAALTLQDASDLNEHEKSFLLRKFFQLAPEHMVLPYPRYRELRDRRGTPDPQGVYATGLKLYSTRDYRDLQMWYNLAWCGQELRRDPEIAAFLARGRDFTEPDKKRLLEIQFSFMGRILPLYRNLSASKKVELSVSPYYHPILPLLCDLRSAREALPSIVLPEKQFVFPEDAREQITLALLASAQLFGSTARGLWPSEGAISDAALRIAGEEGLRWMASDETVLWNSLRKEGRASGALPPKQKYCAYRSGEDEGPCLFFRDHALSDLLGFSYRHWSAADAVKDFLGRLRAIDTSLPGDGRNYVVPVILDGENAWEHYPNNGADFLSLLYGRLEESEDIRTVTFSEFLDLESHREPIGSLVPGSWISGNLATWIGHAEKNRAWEELGAARRLLNSVRFGGGVRQQLDSAFREVMIAEGSDWFWWYGDDHQTENAAEYDALFRGHLKNVYRLLGEAPPLRLEEPIKKADTGTRYRKPVHTFTPKLDGKATDYFEWISAGFAIPEPGDSMHRTDRYLEKVSFGFDRRYFYLRIDLPPAKMAAFPVSGSIRLQFGSPRECLLALERGDTNAWRCKTIQWPVPDQLPGFGAAKFLELGIPLEALGVLEPVDVTFFISILAEGRELERFPAAGFCPVHTDPWNLDQHEWIV